MTEATYTSPKAKSKPASTSAASAFELPKFELPSFEVPKIEIPVVLRELAEKSVSQAKETYEKLKSAADEATDVLEETCATATKGASDLSLKLIEAARENTNAAFDFAAEIMTVKSFSDVVELSTRHTRKQDRPSSATRPRGRVQGRSRPRGRPFWLVRTQKLANTKPSAMNCTA